MKKSVKNPKPEQIFRNELAKKWYAEIIKNDDIYEHGIDCNGNVYFAFLNGNINRSSRKEFLNYCKSHEAYINSEEYKELEAGYKKYGMY
jgi:hypothetical protein